MRTMCRSRQTSMWHVTSVCFIWTLLSPLEASAQVTVGDLVEGYDYNTSLLQDLSITFTYAYTPAEEWEECKRQSFPYEKSAHRAALERGHELPFVDKDGKEIPFDSVTDEMWWERINASMLPIISHRYMEKGPVLRSWQNGMIREDGTFLTENRITFDGQAYKGISPPAHRGVIAQTHNFHKDEEPRKFLPRIDHQRGWPDFARGIPADDAEIKMAGVEEVDGHKVYKVSHTRFLNPWLRANAAAIAAGEIDTDDENVQALLGMLHREVHIVDVDPQRGFQAVGWVMERSFRRTRDEQFAIIRRIIVDNVTLQPDASGQAWFITAARIREYVQNPCQMPPIISELEWPVELIQTNTRELVTHEVRINQGIADDDFKIEFPDGYGVHNRITGTAYVVGGAPPDTAILDGAARLRKAQAATEECLLE